VDSIAQDQLQAERRRIAEMLHNGILQDLTVAGLRLGALERSNGATAAELHALAQWLGERQAALRYLVSDLSDAAPPVAPGGRP
jgi:signal transduction histidine kinase